MYVQDGTLSNVEGMDLNGTSYNTLLNGSSGGSSIGSTIGSAILPGLGGAVGGIIGGLASSLLGSPTAYAPGAFAGKHSPFLQNLDDSKVKAPDAATYLRIAKDNNIDVESVAVLMAWDADQNGIDAQKCWDGYAAGTSPLKAYFSSFNASGQGQIVPGQPSPYGATRPLRAIANYDGAAKFINLAPTSSSSVEGMGTSPVVQTLGSQAVNTQAQGAINSLPPRHINLQMPATVATPGIVDDSHSPKDGTSSGGGDAAAKSNTTTYALIGGGALLLLAIVVLLIKK